MRRALDTEKAIAAAKSARPARTVSASAWCVGQDIDRDRPRFEAAAMASIDGQIADLREVIRVLQSAAEKPDRRKRQARGCRLGRTLHRAHQSDIVGIPLLARSQHRLVRCTCPRSSTERTKGALHGDGIIAA